MAVAGLQAPCTVTSWLQWAWYNVIFIPIFNSLDIYVFNGPHWDTDLPKICDKFGKTICEGIQGAIGRLYNVSAKSYEHYAQNGQTFRFQEYAEHYFELQPLAKKVDLSKINDVKVAMWVGEKDGTCPPHISDGIKNDIGD